MKMLRVVVLAMLLGVSLAATLNKKDGYGGSSAAYSTHTSYGTSGSSYDVGSAPSYSSGSDYGSSPSASYNSASGNTDQGNLYYYYYPVTNHSNSPSYGGANNNYYPPAPVPPPYNEPLGGLLSLVGAIDVNSLILPALLIGGVALLLPAILNCDLELGTCVIPLPFSNGGGRNGRQMSEWSLQQATIPQMIDSAYRVYDAVNDNEKCMQRVVCEFGGMMRNIPAKETFFSVMEYFASPNMKKQLYVLRQGALAVPNSNPACSKFECSKLDNRVE